MSQRTMSANPSDPLTRKSLHFTRGNLITALPACMDRKVRVFILLAFRLGYAWAFRLALPAGRLVAKPPNNVMPWADGFIAIRPCQRSAKYPPQATGQPCRIRGVKVTATIAAKATPRAVR